MVHVLDGRVDVVEDGPEAFLETGRVEVGEGGKKLHEAWVSLYAVIKDRMVMVDGALTSCNVASTALSSGWSVFAFFTLFSHSSRPWGC